MDPELTPGDVMPPRPADDAALVRACLAGSSSAWSALVDRYGRLVYSIPRRYGLTEPDQDDVFQTVFTTLHQKLDTLRDESRLSSWLITTTHRACWRIGRRNPITADDLAERLEDVHTPPDAELTAWEEQDAVHRALRELGGRCETLLRALFLGGREADYAAIAAELDMKIGSIGPTRARCFEKLRPILVRLGLGNDGDLDLPS